MKPVFTMLVNAVRWSESIAMAMESKGFSGESKRSYYSVPRVCVWDILGAVIMIGGIGAGMVVK
jgi:energy-coupling factor transport system permease protein